MSYEIAKSISVNRKRNKITICAANSSLRPLWFETVEYCKNKDVPMEDKIKMLWKDMLNGNIKPYKSCKKVFDILSLSLVLKRSIENMISSVIPEMSLWDIDRYYETKLYDEVLDIIIEKFSYPAFTTGTSSSEELTQTTTAFMDKVQAVYAEKKEEFEKAGIVLVNSALTSPVFPGYDVFVAGDEAILAPQQNYANGKGRLDNSKDDAIFFGPKTAFLFSVLGYKNKIVNNTELVNFHLSLMDYKPKIGVLPYENFPYEQLGFELLEV